MGCPAHEHNRRTFVGLLGVGLAVTVAGCGADRSAGPAATTPARAKPAWTPYPSGPRRPLPPVPAARAGRCRTVFTGTPADRRICLTVDDGYCKDCVRGYVEFAQRSGVHLTFSPNGAYGPVWSPHADVLRPLVEGGQVQFMNHTFSHRDLRTMSEAQIRKELEKNDDWVVRTFGVTTRPYYRPPYGYHNASTDGVAGSLGYTRAIMWDGTFGDATLISAKTLMKEARRYLQPGTMMLGHANHPTILGLFDEILVLIQHRKLTPVTLDEMFGTSRASG